MESNYNNFSEIESELFALVTSVINLYNKYQEGLINQNFLKKSINNAMKGIYKINLYYNEKDVSILSILKKMDFIEEYNQAVKIFKRIISMRSLKEDIEISPKTTTQFQNDFNFSLLELPGITSEITSSLITLMDALKLEGLKSSELIFKLFKDLKKNIKKFPGLDNILLQINEVYIYVINHPHKLIENRGFRNAIVDRLYQIFKEFQQKLILKP